jgi:hypothetical protein
VVPGETIAAAAIAGARRPRLPGEEGGPVPEQVRAERVNGVRRERAEALEGEARTTGATRP